MASNEHNNEQEASASSGEREKYTFFWRADSPFSQWHDCKFSVNGFEYNCAEQYMMHQKALLFNDEKIAADIMKSNSPKTQKGLGRKVSNFDDNEWKAKCRGIVEDGSYAKFGQNEELYAELVATAGTVLVEASPRDTIWGIGMGATNPKALNKATWRGKNWLGYALTHVRDRLMQERGTEVNPNAHDGAVTAGTEEHTSHSKRPRYTFFWRADSPFSQWHDCKFSVNGFKYNCAEQYMMHQKALLFNDEEIAAAIMESDCPRTQKGLGRKVSNFDDNEWNAKCRGIVEDGNYAKFGQNEELYAELVATAGTVLVEASPRDTIWGIGLAATNPKALNKATWRGKNWLGYALTHVRDRLMQERGTEVNPNTHDRAVAAGTEEHTSHSKRKRRTKDSKDRQRMSTKE